MDSDKGSNEGMIFFRVELLRLRDLVRAVGLSLSRLEGLSEKKIEKIQIINQNKNKLIKRKPVVDFLEEDYIFALSNPWNIWLGFVIIVDSF